MHRRSFLATTVMFGGLAGCSAVDTGTPAARTTQATPGETPTATWGPQATEPPECVDPSRPNPDGGSAAVDPVPYPDERPAITDSDAMADYIGAYEDAYRTNSLLEEYGSALNDVYFGVGEPQFFDAPPASVIGRLRYTYGFETESYIADSPTIYASYYVDEAVVVRAERRGYLEDETVLKPNPLEAGTVLECFRE